MCTGNVGICILIHLACVPCRDLIHLPYFGQTEIEGLPLAPLRKSRHPKDKGGLTIDY